MMKSALSGGSPHAYSSWLPTALAILILAFASSHARADAVVQDCTHEALAEAIAEGG